jgi:hypothetical protein
MLKPTPFIVLLCFSTSIALAQQANGSAQSNPQSENAISVLENENNAFKKWHIAPIIIAEGERVGDIIDTDTTALIASEDDCFNKLSVQHDQSNLPDFSVLSEKGLAAALGAGDVATASGEAKEGVSFVLDFKDVHVERVSTVQFRTKLKANVPECAQIRQFIDASYVPKNKIIKGIKTADATLNGAGIVVSDKPPPLLIGTLFRARRVIRVRITQDMDAKAQLSFGAKLLDNLGLGSRFTVSGAGGSSSTNTLTIEANDVVPVALVPAFVVTATNKLASGQLQFNVASVNSDVILTQVALAKETEDRSFVSVWAFLHDKAPGADSKTPVVNADTWKFEPYDGLAAKLVAKSEVKLAAKKDPFQVMFVNQHDLELFRPTASDIKG